MEIVYKIIAMIMMPIGVYFCFMLLTGPSIFIDPRKNER